MLRDEDDEPIDRQLLEGGAGERDVAYVRRVEAPAQDPDQESSTTSSPIATSSPGFAPAAFSAAASSFSSGGLPATR